MASIEIKITKNLLKNYQKYKREIPFLKAELEEMLTSDAGIGNSTILDYQNGYPRPQSVVGFDWGLYEHRKQTLKYRELQVKTVDQKYRRRANPLYLLHEIHRWYELGEDCKEDRIWRAGRLCEVTY